MSKQQPAERDNPCDSVDKPHDPKAETTHFGYKTVASDEKADKVAEVFDSVAESYDLMNDLMSLGIHRLWKHCAIDRLRVKKGHRVLDLAGGSGDLTLKIAPKIAPDGRVTLSDINPQMLKVGKRRLLDAGLLQQIDIVTANAEELPFPDNHFDRIIIGFGLRNVTDKQRALESMYRCLKPGGLMLVLEFSKPVLPLLNKIYDVYSFKILPRIGDFVANDADSYRYLAESIRMHPDQQTLQQMMQQAGFEDVKYQNLSGGIVAMHWGYRY